MTGQDLAWTDPAAQSRHVIRPGPNLEMQMGRRSGRVAVGACVPQDVPLSDRLTHVRSDVAQVGINGIQNPIAKRELQNHVAP